MILLIEVGSYALALVLIMPSKGIRWLAVDTAYVPARMEAIPLFPVVITAYKVVKRKHLYLDKFGKAMILPKSGGRNYAKY